MAAIRHFRKTWKVMSQAPNELEGQMKLSFPKLNQHLPPMTPQTFSSQHIPVSSPSLLDSLSLSLYELQLSSLMPPSSTFSLLWLCGCGMDWEVHGVVEQTSHIGRTSRIFLVLPYAIGGNSMRNDFGAASASANVQDSVYNTGADGDCPIQAQVELYFSFSELSTSQHSHLSWYYFWYHHKRKTAPSHW